MVKYTSFLDMPAPEGYVPGLGRGATGFTTRSDIGPARATSIDEGTRIGSSQNSTNEGDMPDNEERFRDPENDIGIFSSTLSFDPEDEEADLIYNNIDQRMKGRRRPQTESHERAKEDELKEKKTISERFSDLKRGLDTLTEEDWANLPEVGDLTKKYKRQRKLQQQQQRFYSVPDSIAVGAQNMSSIDPNIEGNRKPTNEGYMTDFRSISSARDKMLGMKLDQWTNKSSTSIGLNENSTLDPDGYLTSLAGSRIQETEEVGDIRRLRPLLKSLVASNPKDPSGWIGLARLEELANRVQKAILVIEEGCRNNPKSEDAWLENIRLSESTSKEYAKKTASRAVHQIPKSISLWLKASNLESDLNSQKAIIRKALENNPKSDTLWKNAVSLESEPSEAKLLLTQAVELVPFSEELWLALARLETTTEAKKVLNRARKALKTSRAVWITAARLEEEEGSNQDKVNKRIQRGVRELREEGELPDRKLWISEAENCEKNGAPLTCRAIINATIELGLEESEKKAIWMEDGRRCTHNGFYETARAIYSYLLKAYPQSDITWLALCKLEKTHGTKDLLFSTLEKAVQTCSKNQTFWLMYAKEKKAFGDVDGAQEVLQRAFEENPNSEDIWLSAVNMEAENREFDKARYLLKQARTEADTERVWIKSVSLERRLKDNNASLRLVMEGIEKYPKSDKLWMQRGQIYEFLGEHIQALGSYKLGIKEIPNSVPLWLLQSRLEEILGMEIKARSTLEKAALANGKNERIWLERVKLEIRSGNNKQANVLLARALQEIPRSGLLWSESVLQTPLVQRKAKIKEAISSCGDSPRILETVAREFWRMGKYGKAKTWYEKSLQKDPDYGDTWMWYYKFLQDQATRTFTSEKENSLDALNTLLERFLVAEPRHGNEWPKFTKDPDNFGKSISEILKIAVKNLKSPE